MRIVIHQNESKLYLKGPDAWTADIKEAMIFSTVKEAEKFCHQYHLVNVSIVVSYRDSSTAQ